MWALSHIETPKRSRLASAGRAGPTGRTALHHHQALPRVEGSKSTILAWKKSQIILFLTANLIIKAPLGLLKG